MMNDTYNVRLMDDLNEKTEYWKLKEETLDCCVWRIRFGRSYGPVVRKTKGSMNKPN